MKRHIVLAILLTSFFTHAQTNNKNAWDGWNDPFKMDPSFESHFDKLPTKGELASKGLAWPGYYWANNKGGIAQRWSSKNPRNFKYESPSLYEAQAMSSEQINELSPAEKYDLFMGEYNYPTVEASWSYTRRSASPWFGICHGVAPASLNHTEPKTVTVTNSDGIKIKFYSSDIKALLAYYYGKVSETDVIQVGKRCFIGAKVPVARSTSGCRDVNPGSMHIIMTNKLGLSKTGYIADMDRYRQVWNHAAVAYDYTVVGSSAPTRNSASSATNRLKIEANVKYSASIDPALTPVIATDLAKYDSRKYSYYLELNSRGQIVGGEWISSDRPDFMWIKQKDTFNDYWKGLYKIYKAAKK